MTSTLTSGVWLSDVPLTVNEGAKGNVVLKLHFRGDLIALSKFERVEEAEIGEKAYREWQVPAALLVGARIEVVDDDD